MSDTSQGSVPGALPTSLTTKDHGVDCSYYEWGWDGIEGISGDPCDCWRSILGLPEEIA